MNQNNVHLIQNHLYLMINTLIKILDENQINYYLIGGTLLGAIRHKGFIPWDDDIDIAMPRVDYERFKNLSKKILPINYEFKDAFIEPGFPSFQGKLIDSNTTLIERTKLLIKTGISIDIFPIDNIDNDIVKAQKTLDQIKKLRVMYSIRNNVYNINKDNLFISKIIRPLLVMFTRNKKIIAKVNKIIKNKRISESKYCASYFGALGYRDIYEWSWVSDYVKGSFGGLDSKLPCGYKRILEKAYGDYMVLPEIGKRITHHNFISIDFKKSFKSED